MPRKPASRPAKSSAKGSGFSDAEKAAMRERARELKAEARAGKDKAAGERAVRATLAALAPPDRALGERLHSMVIGAAPALRPKLWYGMPAYANDDGKVVCFFQPASKFKTRYSTFCFQDPAKLDDGGVWATGFAVVTLSPRDEAMLAGLVRRATS